MRSIMAIRRATQVIVPRAVEDPEGNIPGVNQDGEFRVTDAESPSASDAEDAGGEAVHPGIDKATLRLKRSFELVLRTGHVVRFEAYSCTVALQWIAKLQSLVSYWTRRHRVDAREEMDLTHAIRGRPKWGSSKIVPDAAADHPHLEEFWNWCVLEGCRPIIKAGRLYEKRGIHKQFRHMYHVLTHGHIVQYHLTASKSAHHHRSRTINLLDAYIYSGQLAVVSLAQSYTEDTSVATPRRYQDGLESDDTEEDVTFIVWYRPHPPGIGSEDVQAGQRNVTVAPLDGKHKMLICKARSILERDSWCFALNAEIERLARLTSSREKNLRET